MFNPLLWNVFQNDLPCSITTAKLSIYVDEHQLYTSRTNFTAEREALEQEDQLDASWYRDNVLLTNPDKFQAMILYNRDIDIEG